ncbi:MAG: hypothetical protein ACI8S6_005461, partial [Myxococcota bacterium]
MIAGDEILLRVSLRDLRGSTVPFVCPDCAGSHGVQPTATSPPEVERSPG